MLYFFLLWTVLYFLVKHYDNERRFEVSIDLVKEERTRCSLICEERSANVYKLQELDTSITDNMPNTNTEYRITIRISLLPYFFKKIDFNCMYIWIQDWLVPTLALVSPNWRLPASLRVKLMLALRSQCGLVWRCSSYWWSRFVLAYNAMCRVDAYSMRALCATI